MSRFRPTRQWSGRSVRSAHATVRPGHAAGVRSWGQYTGWGRLLAADGLAALVPEHRAVAEAGFDAVVAEVAAP
ncbi:MAG TPA: hypothetical protein VJ735_22375, partial [Actinomycetes bacterium]|nr:hypothetical protein [Actinomycetes bacterium]